MRRESVAGFFFFFFGDGVGYECDCTEKLNLFTFLIKMLIRDITEYAMKLSVRFMDEIFLAD